MSAPFEIRHARERELEDLDQSAFHSEREFEIYQHKGDLGARTRLANLLAKQVILEKMQLSLKEHARDVVIDRLTAQGFGYGMPVVHLSNALQGQWSRSFGGTPHISLSHEGDRFVAALTNKTSEEGSIGVDVMSITSIATLHQSGALNAYISDAEREALDSMPNSDEKKGYALALWCVKEAVFKAIASDSLLGANNRFRYIQTQPQTTLEGSWSVTILTDDQPLQFKDRWYPRLNEIFRDRHLDPQQITASFQKIDADFGLAVVTLGHL